MTPLESLAAWASSLAPQDVPQEQHRLARLRVLDTIGLIAVATDHPAGRSLAAWASRNGGAISSYSPSGTPSSTSPSRFAMSWRASA